MFKWMHTWMGLVTGLVIAVVSLTGSVAVFRNEIDLASSAHASSAPGVVGLDEITRQIATARPDAEIRRVRFPEQAGDPFIVQIQAGGKQERLICEASTGRPVGTLNTGFVDWTIDLHRNLLAGKTGRKAVGFVGIILFTMAATGMLLWLLGARQWRSWISVRSQAGSRKFHFELHRATGLWSYALLTVVSFVGIGLAFPDTFRGTLQQVTGSPAPAKAPRIAKSTAGARATLDEYLHAATAAMPDGVPTELRLPENEKSPVDLRLRRAGDISSSGNHVYLDPASNKVLAVSRLADQPLATRIFSAFAPIHYGEFGGLPIKVIWGVLGLMPSVLFVTGLFTWWRPKQRTTPVPVKEDVPVAASAGD